MGLGSTLKRLPVLSQADQPTVHRASFTVAEMTTVTSSMGNYPPQANTLKRYSPEEIHKLVDEFHDATLLPEDAAIDAAIQSQAAHDPPIPDINVTKQQGQFLQILLAQNLAGSPNLKSGEYRAIELGTLAGVSTIWMARVLLPKTDGKPLGKVVTIETNPIHVKVARENFKRAGVDGVVELKEGDCTAILKELLKDESFKEKTDFVFMDADKESYPVYLELAYQLCRPGAVILCDNTIRQGAIVEPDHPDSRVQGVIRFNKILKEYVKDGKLKAMAYQTVGSKGYDGFTLLMKL
ncbi:S-adenosyl-L-methionine-dependent methyltransferase [Atractiella rhizophila]|nr:S-adenosyl-L-methionine-dependent methyltransferase [Atractiella rhizophila]